MTADQARQVLQDMQGAEISAERLSIALDYVESEIGDSQGEGARKLRLDGYFNADQLEAMALWLRNPSAVSGQRQTSAAEPLHAPFKLTSTVSVLR